MDVYLFRMSVRISVALCTRNCAPYLGAQLDSILAQQRLPDELVVGDEASSDGSHEILKRFAQGAPFPVIILRNPEPLGVAANFTQVIRRCAGDVIALCDHDDVWHQDRLAEAEQAMADPGVSLAFSNASLINAEGRPLPGLLWETLGLDLTRLETSTAPEAFSALLARRVATGGTMTLRADTARWALPIAEGWYQDEWLAQLAALRGRLKPIRQPLMQYRQHGNNAVGAQRDGFLSRAVRSFDGRHRERLRRQLTQLEILRADFAAREGVPAWAADIVERRLAHVVGRLEVRGGGAQRLRAVVRELRSGRYADDPMGRWSALQDLLG